MVQLIVGVKGKGKTKVLLDKVNSQIQAVEGNIVYLDKSAKHMYELNNKIRLINMADYPVKNADAFIGFILGIISQDNDLEAMYLDSFMKIANLEDADITETVQKLEEISKDFNVDFTLSVSLDTVPEAIKGNVEVAL